MHDVVRIPFSEQEIPAERRPRNSRLRAGTMPKWLSCRYHIQAFRRQVVDLTVAIAHSFHNRCVWTYTIDHIHFVDAHEFEDSAQRFVKPYDG
jgi:hypothetical protein